MTAPSAMRRSELRRRLLPPHRTWQVPAGRHAAAVLVPVIASADGEALLFVKRRDDLRHHAGQVAFPGGRADGDEDPVACALRELHEEVNIAGNSVDVLGSLPCHASGAGFEVHPIVGALEQVAALRIDDRELAAAFTVPMARLADQSLWTTHEVDRNGVRFRTPAFDVGEHRIWGLTARVVRDLLAHWP